MSGLRQDVRQAFRGLRKDPSFSAVAILTLALGIGATTSIYTLANAVLVRPLPIGQPDRVAYIAVWNPRLNDLQARIADTGIGALAPSNADFLDVQREAKSFESMALFDQTSINLAAGNTRMRFGATRVTGEFFRALDVAPVIGRPLDANDERIGGRRVAVISHALWQSEFGGDPDILHRRLHYNTQTADIVGVMPRAFDYPGANDLGPDAAEQTDVWLPMRLTPEQRAEREFPDASAAIGRLRPNVSLAEARAEMNGLMARLDQLHSAEWRGWYPVVKPFPEIAIGKSRHVMWLLLGAVFLVLMIACANSGHLLLARASSRAQEMGVRAALGAGRARIFRQIALEALLLAIAGGILGVALAAAAIRWLPLIDPGNIPRLDQASIDWRVLLFATGVSLGTGVAFGLMPGIAMARADIAGLLARGRSRGTTAASRRGRQVLIAAEVAIAVVLLFGATLLLRSYANVQRAERGFSESTLTMHLTLDARYPEPDRRLEFFANLLASLRRLPGVDSAGAASAVPLSHSESISSFRLEGYPNRPNQMVDARWVTGQYFDAMGTRLIEGRLLTDDDIAGRQPVVVVNQAFARTYFGDESAVGRRYRIYDLLNEANDSRVAWSTIVGVVGDVRHSNLEDQPAPQVYSSYWQGEAGGSMYIAVRTSLPLVSAVPAVRGLVQSMDPILAIANLRVMDERIWSAGARRRFQTTLVSAFGVFAVGLAAFGLYGVMAHAVSQRRAEIGIRLAVGAQRADVMTLILGEGLKVTAAGIAIGILCAFGLTRVLQSLLYGVTRSDPIAFATVVVVLFATSVIACAAPAIRACRTDPIAVLRQD